jgi:hypothetical protein
MSHDCKQRDTDRFHDRGIELKPYRNICHLSQLSPPYTTDKLQNHPYALVSMVRSLPRSNCNVPHSHAKGEFRESLVFLHSMNSASCTAWFLRNNVTNVWACKLQNKDMLFRIQEAAAAIAASLFASLCIFQKQISPDSSRGNIPRYDHRKKSPASSYVTVVF